MRFGWVMTAAEMIGGPPAKPRSEQSRSICIALSLTHYVAPHCGNWWSLLEGQLAVAEPKTLRYRLLHVAARIIHHTRRRVLRLQSCWPWAAQLALASTRLHALPLRC